MAVILFSRKHVSVSGDVPGCHDLGSRGRGQGTAKHHTTQDRPTTKDRLAPKASSAEAKKPGHPESFPLSRSSRQQGLTRRRHPNLFRRMNVVHFFYLFSQTHSRSWVHCGARNRC